MMKMQQWCVVMMVVMSGLCFGFSGGDGSSGNPYQITTRQHLEAVNNAPNAHYILMNDIDLIGTVYDNSVIAFDTDHTTTSFDGVAFSGHFDGNGKVIKNLTLSTTEYGFLGLFGSVSGVIENLGLEDVNVTGTGYWRIGGLVGDLSGQIKNCWVTGTIQGSTHHTGGLVGLNTGLVKGCWADVEATGVNRVGALVGSNSTTGVIADSQGAGLIRGSNRVGGITGNCTGAIVKNSSSSATVQAISTDEEEENYFGGIVGRCESNSLIINSYATGDVTGDMLSSGRWTGGLAGYIRDNTVIANCYATGTVQAGYVEIGGLLGRNEDSLVMNSYATGDVIGDAWSTYEIGGLVGFNRDGGVIVHCYSTGQVTGALVGGLVGGDLNSTTINSFWDMTTSGAGWSDGGTGLSTTAMQDVTTFVGAGWTFYDDPSAGAAPQWIISAGQYPQIYRLSDSFVSPFVAGDGTPNNPYQIATPDQLEAIVYDMTASYILLNDIDLTARPVGAVALLAPHLGGTDTTYQGLGFYGVLDGGGNAIKNLTLNGGQDENFLGLFGFINPGGVVANLGVEDADIVGNRAIGVLAGENTGTVSHCYATGQVTGNNIYIGGLVGGGMLAGGRIQDSHAAVAVTGLTTHAGGLIGRNAGTIVRSSAAGDVTCSGDYAAGLTGFNADSGSITNSFATGTVSGERYIGGLVGRNHGPITYSHATGKVTASGTWAGGLVGYNDPADIAGCYAKGDVVGHGVEVGGLIGRNATGDITDCYAEGSVTGYSDYTGGLIGRMYAGNYVNLCYATGNVVGRGQYVGGLLGTSSGSVMNSHATGSVTQDNDANYVGGLIGINYSAGVIYNSHAAGTVQGDRNYIGGLVGRNYGEMTGSSATGNVFGNNSSSLFVGGLVGENDGGTITDCFAGGNASAGSYTGGLVGRNQSVITNSYATGNADSIGQYSGGLAARNGGTITESFATGNVSAVDRWAGGFVGYTDGTIERCYAFGSATSQTGDAGGFAGDNRGLITNCYAEGDATAPARAGGFVGAQRFGGATPNLTKCYSTGSASGSTEIGGFAGIFTTGSLTDCFWDVETSGLSDGVGVGDDSGVTGLTAAAMLSWQAFVGAGWDFADVWLNCEGFSLPRLAWQAFADADINLDGIVDMTDLGFLADYWLEDAAGLCVDLYADGVVDFLDFSVLSSEWLISGPPTEEDQDIKVFYGDGRFAGWPANYGMWSWGDELLVSFRTAYHDYEEPVDGGHSSKAPFSEQFSRSLDGGLTWQVEDIEPVCWYRNQGAFTNAGQIPGPIDFTHPDLALRFARSPRVNDDSYIIYSYDRGHSWEGPYLFPNLDPVHPIDTRTDYIIDGEHELLAFLSIGSGRTGLARTEDGGVTWEFVSYIGPDFASPGTGIWSFMPSSIRLSGSSLLTVLRYEKSDAECGLKAYRSDDNGATWSELTEPLSPRPLRRSSPPALTRLDDGRIVLVYAIRNVYPGISRICAKISDDDGASWSEEIVLRQDAANWDMGYPRIAQRPDGKIVVVYYYNQAMNEDKTPYRYIAATVLDPDAAVE